MGIGRRGRFEIASMLLLILALGARSGPARAQVPLEPTDLKDLQETVSEQIEETSIEIPDTGIEAVDSGIGGGGGVGGATADTTEAVGLSSPAQTSSAGAGGGEKATESQGGVERRPRAKGDQSAAGSRGKAGPRFATGRVGTPAQVTACPQEDGRWVVSEEDPFGGYWQGSPASGILVFSSTRGEVRFNVDEGFALEAVCWQTINGVGGGDARLESIDPDTYAVTVRGRSAAALEELTFSVTPPPGQESAEEGVLGLVIRRGDLATTGLRLVGLAGLELLLLVSGAVLIRRARHHPDPPVPSSPGRTSDTGLKASAASAVQQVGEAIRLT